MNNKSQDDFGKAVWDVLRGTASIHVWPMLGWQEIKQRYRRSTLGPFWLTISTGALIGGMGPLYGKLFGANLAQYVPHLAVSYILWILLSSLINDACTTFIAAEGLIKQIRMPLSIHVLRAVWRNMLVFFHNAVILLILVLFFPPPLSWHLILIPFGLLFIALNGVWVGLVLGMLCARYRDIPQIVGSVVQILFFLTPVVYRGQSLGRYGWAAKWNPLNQFLEVVRAPLLGGPVTLFTWAMIGAITVLGFAGALALFARYRARVAYWV